MGQTQLRRLSARDCAAVVAVERQSYDRTTQEPVEIIEARLRFEDEHYSSLNLGLFDDERLVGYILAHLDDGAEFPGQAIGDNVYAADLAILPGHRRHLASLLAAFLREVRLEYPGLPVVAHALEGAGCRWHRHEAYFRHNGFRMTRQVDGVPARGDHLASLVVWEPIAVTPGADGDRGIDLRRPSTRRMATDGRSLRTIVVTDEDGLRGLAEPWTRLEPTIPGLTVFQTHRYQAAWVRSFGLNRQIMIVCVLDDDQMIGIAPFQVMRVRVHGKVYRQLSFLGAPWEVDRPRFLFGRDVADCAEATAQALLARREQWDAIWFHEQDATDPALEAFCTTLARHGLLHGRAPSSHCPYLSLQGTWPQFLASKSQKFRKNLRVARSRLQATGAVRYQSHSGDARQLQELFAEYEELEGRSWKAQDAVGVSQSVEHLRFYRHLIDHFGPTRQFVLRSLHIGDRLVAATFGLVHERTFYSLHIAHDANFSRCSPGTLLESLELEECFGSELDEYDFLGGFLKNKVRWATQMRDTAEVHLYQKQPRLVLAYAFYFMIKPPLKRVLSRLGVRWPGKPRTDRAEPAG
jgi:CelD/BcsL family acetyltransferase involved in cellulose biosynthesis